MEKRKPAPKKTKESGLTEWKKPNGKTILLNDNPATVAEAIARGWKRGN